METSKKWVPHPPLFLFSFMTSFPLLPRHCLSAATCSLFPDVYTFDMELPLSLEQERELSELADRKGREPGDLAREVISFYLEHEARFVEAVKRGIASADSRKLIEHEEVMAGIDRLFQS